LGKIDLETYQLTYEHLNEQIIKISKEMNNGKVKIFNLGNLLKNALGKLENISKIWVSAALEEKKVLQKTLFPEGIYYDMKNNRYLTRKTNQFIELVTCISISCEEIKKEDLQYKIEKSSLVSGSRLELPSAAADMNPLLPSLTEISFSF